MVISNPHLFKSLGQKLTSFAGFDTFPAPANVNHVSMQSEEMTALCPVTNQPDWYHVSIGYTPRDKCLESKSLKLYLHSFRDEGMFGEALASKIVDDIYEAIDPYAVHVSLLQKARGGVTIITSASRGEDLPDDE